VPEKRAKIIIICICVCISGYKLKGGEGCMTVCVQKGSWFPVCTQNWSFKDDLHVVISVQLSSIFRMTLNVLLLADEHFIVKGKNGAEYSLSQVNKHYPFKTKTFFLH
jgi:hypothetical protein